MLGVHAHDACVVHHLDLDHHVVVGLHDALVVVVEAGDRRRGAGKAEQAALGVVADLHVVVGAGLVSLVDPPGGALVLAPEAREQLAHALLSEGGHGRELTVLGIDDDRGAVLAVDRHGAGAAIDPEGVVATDVAGGARRAVATLGWRLAIGIAHGRALGDRLGPPPLRSGLGFLLGQVELVAELGGPQEGSQRGGVVGAGEIRPAGRRAGQLFAGGDRAGNDGDCEERGENGAAWEHGDLRLAGIRAPERAAPGLARQGTDASSGVPRASRAHARLSRRWRGAFVQVSVRQR